MKSKILRKCPLTLLLKYKICEINPGQIIVISSIDNPRWEIQSSITKI